MGTKQGVVADRNDKGFESLFKAELLMEAHGGLLSYQYGLPVRVSERSALRVIGNLLEESQQETPKTGPLGKKMRAVEVKEFANQLIPEAPDRAETLSNVIKVAGAIAADQDMDRSSEEVLSSVQLLERALTQSLNEH